MAPFDIKEVRELMEGDELELDKLGDRKTALFCVVSDVDTTFNFIAAMVYTQMFNVLCDKALENGGALKQHVTCLLDEFANQKIPNFQHLISVIRSREISAHIVVQTQIFGNLQKPCDMLFAGKGVIKGHTAHIGQRLGGDCANVNSFHLFQFLCG